MEDLIEIPHQVTVIGSVLSIEDRRFLIFFDTCMLEVSITENDRHRLNDARKKAGMDGLLKEGVDHVVVRLRSGDKVNLGPDGRIRVVFEFKPERVVRTVRGYCIEFPKAGIRSIGPASD